MFSREEDTRSPSLQGNPVTSVTLSSTSALLYCCTMAPVIEEASTSWRQGTRVRQPTLRFSPGREEERGRGGSQGTAQLGRNRRTSQRVLQSSAPPGLPRQMVNRGFDSDSDIDRAGRDSDKDTGVSDADSEQEQEQEQEQVAARRAAMTAVLDAWGEDLRPEVAPAVQQGPAAGRDGEEVALAAGRGGGERRRDPPHIVGRLRIYPHRVRGTGRAGGGGQRPAAEQDNDNNREARQEEEVGEGRGEVQPQRVEAGAPAGAEPLLQPQRRVVAGLVGEQEDITAFLNPDLPEAGPVTVDVDGWGRIDGLSAWSAPSQVLTPRGRCRWCTRRSG